MSEENVFETPTLKDNDLILRRVTESDIKDRVACGRTDEITFMYGGEENNKPYTEENGRKWYQKQLDRNPGWVIEYHGKCVGEAFLHHIDLQDKRARFAIGFFDSCLLGKGLGTKATKLILEYSFNELKLHRVDLRVLEYNERAIKSYEKAGFKQEGRERESAFIRGQWHDDIMMSILEQEFRQTSK
jgi:ribosomal-protein-alanine N-acetyltransferase